MHSPTVSNSIATSSVSSMIRGRADENMARRRGSVTVGFTRRTAPGCSPIVFIAGMRKNESPFPLDRRCRSAPQRVQASLPGNKPSDLRGTTFSQKLTIRRFIRSPLSASNRHAWLMANPVIQRQLAHAGRTPVYLARLSENQPRWNQFCPPTFQHPVSNKKS